MIKKIETWLSKIIAKELFAIDASLVEERNRLVSAISIHAKAALIAVEVKTTNLLEDFEQKLVAEASLVVAEKNKLIEELHAKVIDLEATTRKITHWKADSETVAQDHTLKVSK